MFTGHWPVWNITKMFEGARIIPLTHGYLGLHSENFLQSRTLVVVKQAIKLNPNLHRRVTKFTPLTMKFLIEVLEVGESSFVLLITMKDANTWENLGENFLKYVVVGRKSRRPEALPSWFRGRYAPKIAQEISHIRKAPIPDIPPNVFKYSIKPLPSEMDSNNHINQAEYVKFCMDCATLAAKSRFYKHFHTDMCLYTTTLWEVTYGKESFAGDLLEISTWQNYQDYQEILFSISCSGRLIFFAKSHFETENQGTVARSVYSKV